MRDGIARGVHQALVIQSLDGLLALAEHDHLLFQRVLLLLEPLGLLEELLPVLLEARLEFSHLLHLLSGPLSLRIVFHQVS